MLRRSMLTVVAWSLLGSIQRTGAQQVGVPRVAFLGPPALLLDVFRTALAVESQHVGLGKADAADGWSAREAGMRSMPIVAMQPARQLSSALPRVAIAV